MIRTELKRTAFKRTMPTEPKIRMRKCAVKDCRKPFPVNGLQVVCGVECAIAHAEATRKQKVRKERQEGLQKLKRRADHLEDAQKAFNSYVRLRDLLAGHGCISCGRHNAERWNAGHFKSVGAHPELRFNEMNVHLQCARPCNKDQGGNIHKYRIGLLDRIGADGVAFLEGPHIAAKYTVEQAKEITAHYKAKIKALKEAA